MSSAAERCTARLFDLVFAALPGADVRRSRVTASARDHGTTVVVRALSEDTQPTSIANAVQVVRRIAVEIDRFDVDTDESVDAAIVTVHDAVMADPTLAGNADDVSRGSITFDYGDGEAPVVRAVMMFDVTFMHRANALSVSV